MEKNQVLKTISLLRSYSPKRNFTQSLDINFNLRGLNLKKPEENINSFVGLPNHKWRVVKIGAFVDDTLLSKAKEACDLFIKKDDFSEYSKDAKKIKKMAKDVDFFIAQANLMPDIARVFGKVLGPIGKMPNPKTGAVVPTTIPSLKPIVDKLKGMVRIQTKNELSIKTNIGKEDMGDDELTENALTIYNHIFHLLHEDKSKIANVILKLTMGNPFIVGKDYTLNELQSLDKIKKLKLDKRKIKNE